jgi:hypothetical protein
MTSGTDSQTRTLAWTDLDEDTRARLDKKLDGLYGYGGTAAAFERIPVDKQQALLLLMRRLVALDLWGAVRVIDNVYGEGGVGMYFTAWPYLWSTLRRRKDFTRLFARHRDNTGGFLEKSRRNATLHFLYIDNRDDGDDGERHWHVHFDLYGPWGSPLSTARHLLREKFLAQYPDWRAISAWFKAEARP